MEGAIRSLGALAADAPLRMMPSLDDACEVSCLWFARDVPRSARLGLYARLVLDIAATGRSVVVTATCCERLARVASTFLPREVYSGAGSFGRASGHVWLLAGTPRTVLAAALRSAWSYLRRPAAECGLAQARTMLANRQA